MIPIPPQFVDNYKKMLSDELRAQDPNMSEVDIALLVEQALAEYQKQAKTSS